MKCNNTADVYSCHLKGSLLSERSFPLISEWNQGGNDRDETSFPKLKHVHISQKMSSCVTMASLKLMQVAAIRAKIILRASYFSSTCATASAFFFQNLHLDKDSVSILFVTCCLQPNSPPTSERCHAVWAQVCWIWSPPRLKPVPPGGSGAAWSSGPAEPADRPPRRPGPVSV